MSNMASQTDREKFEEFVTEQVLAIGVESSEIRPQATLEDLGLDSLDVVELSRSLTREFEIVVKPVDFEDATTISDLIDVICKVADVG
ncbi:acyl carrier protein [Nocardia sp. NPDC059177]|uniref:acyl carrier protein n=1 Tax=Nocardia sp. NPDC059177 TaxID=3346759 RepID=UPI00369528E8